MNILIVGAGDLGMNLAESLNRLQHQISVVERNTSLLEEISSRLDVLTVEGEGTSLSVLKQAGIEKADLIIAVTPSDEANILICGIAKQYGVKKRIARIRSDEYTLHTSKISLLELGATDVIEAERELVNSVLQYIELPGLLETNDFRKVSLRGYRITKDMPIAGKSLLELGDLMTSAQILVVAIIRSGKSILPSGEQQLLPGDEVISFMPRESFKTYRELINRPETKLRKVIVAGGSVASVHLAEALKPYADRIILVIPDAARAKDAAEELNGIEVLHGDCTDADLLQEISVKHADFFIGAGIDTEDNVMASLLAKAEGAHEVMAIRSDNRHMDLFHTLGIDHVINPLRITLQKIIESIHSVPIGPLLRLRKIDLDVLRIVPDSRSVVIGKKIAEIDKMLQRSVVIGPIVRNGQVIIPRGMSTIEEGDEILALCKHQTISLVNQVFKVKLRS